MRLGAIDKVRLETGVDAAIAKYGRTGRNVIVGILDRGIDWLNNDFRNSDGSTRIAYIFDLTDDTGAYATGNLYGEGTIYTRAQINQALTSGVALPTRDAVGHGTTTAGLAAGNGRNSLDTKYRGIAPDATIICVKIVADGAPAHDDQPAESPFFKGDRIPVAIDFLRDKAAELGLPAVMLLNLGSQGGPTDGSSSLARKIDSTVGTGIPGLVFVTGTGDDGNMPNRARGTVVQGGSVGVQIQKASSNLVFDLWYADSDRFDVTIQTPDTIFGPYLSPTTNDDYDIQMSAELNYYQRGSNPSFSNANNAKREVWINLTGPNGTYAVTLSGRTVSNGRFDATIDFSQFWNPLYNGNMFLNNLAPGSIWDGATAHNNIAPNDYVLRTDWIDIDGVPRSLTGQGSAGQLWAGSSIGPTFDDRLGVDVSAPGDIVMTTYNPKSYWATLRSNLVSDGNGLYGRAGAVSAASPIVAGVIALLLEMNPRLDAVQVRDLLRRTARSDSFTGQTPNTSWGFGKINALAAMDQLSMQLASQVSFTASPNPIVLAAGATVGQTTLSWNAPGYGALRIVVAGNVMAAGLGSSGSTDTGNWVSDGMVFSLVDSISNQTIATATVHTTPGSNQVSFTASPNPIVLAAGTMVGQTTLSWNAPGYSTLQIVVGGVVMAGGLTTSGSSATGSWVSDGLVFSLVNSATGQTIAKVTVSAKPVTAALFQDHFDIPGSRPDLSVWTTEIGPTSYLGRTQLADWVTAGASGKFVISAGGAQLALNTFNPTGNPPGNSLFGTQAKTLASFLPTVNTAIMYNARVQLTSLQPGLVYGFYLYGCPGPCATQHDEVDIELVTNLLQPGGPPLMVQVNNYANEPLGAGHGASVNLPAGFNPLAPHDWTIRWSFARIDYFVDGSLLSSATTHVPQGPMQVNVIAWAPAVDWFAAYSSALQPVGATAQNQSFVALLSSVAVTYVPIP